MQQCNIALKRVQAHRDLLESLGFKFSRLENADVILGACREAYARHAMIDFPNKGLKEEFENANDEADLLLYDILTTFDYAFSDYPELLRKVSHIRQGSSYADKMQDLTDCSVLGFDNRSLLDEINYPIENLERSSELAKKLSDLHAMATVDKSTSPELRITRDKCFSLLKKTVEKALDNARWVLRGDKELAEQFRIQPPPKKRVRKIEPVEAV